MKPNDTIDTKSAVPAEFVDPETGAVDVEALANSYVALESRLARLMHGDPDDVDRQHLSRSLGVPETVDAYDIRLDHDLFEPDPTLNERLHAAGFSQEQAQLLYDLATERLPPMIQTLAADFLAEQELDRLVQAFGGEDRWQEVSRQIAAWAPGGLPDDAVKAMSGTYDGIMALYRLMSNTEPKPITGAVGAGGTDALHAMVKDPRYWRDKDPAFIAQVTDGFRRLYGK